MNTWAAVPGYEGLYEVSDDGEVRSLDRIVRHNYGGQKRLSGRTIRQSTLPGGYRIVALCKEGLATNWRVARLVLTAFRRPPFPGEEACHWDRTPSNNRLDNLRWDIPAGNAADKRIHGTENIGERNHCAILTAAQVKQVREQLAVGVLGRTIADRFGIKQTTVSAIKSRRSWSHV